jgi:hypothetical protein
MPQYKTKTDLQTREFLLRAEKLQEYSLQLRRIKVTGYKERTMGQKQMYHFLTNKIDRVKEHM